MRKTNLTITLLLYFFLIFEALCQDGGIGIGTDDVDPGAILELDATNKGLLLPRVADPVNDITSPTNGLIVYNATTNSLYQYSNGWVPLNPMPQGGIIMWSGKTPPTGWGLCDGENGTPDLRGRFIVGYLPDNTDYDQPGNASTGGATVADMGGEEYVRLEGSHIPRHRHTIPAHDHNVSVSVSGGAHKHKINTTLDGSSGSVGPKPARTRTGVAGGNSVIYYTGETYNSSTIEPDDGDHSHTVSVSENNASGRNTGYVGLVTNSAHENRPPYYVLAFIMKL